MMTFSLEDIAFGRLESSTPSMPMGLHHGMPLPPPPVAAAAAAVAPPPHHAKRQTLLPSTETYENATDRLTLADYVSSLMLPLLVTLGVVLIVLYSLSKTLEYTELFAANERYRMGLFAVNALAVIAGSLVVSATATVGHGGR